jgi:hypothetical protein
MFVLTPYGYKLQKGHILALFQIAFVIIAYSYLFQTVNIAKRSDWTSVVTRYYDTKTRGKCFKYKSYKPSQLEAWDEKVTACMFQQIDIQKIVSLLGIPLTLQESAQLFKALDSTESGLLSLGEVFADINGNAAISVYLDSWLRARHLLFHTGADIAGRGLSSVSYKPPNLQ